MEKKRTRETESAGVGPKGARGLLSMTLVFGCLCIDGRLGCSWGLLNDLPPFPLRWATGPPAPPFFLMTLVLGCLCAGDCLGCSSALWWSMWGREGLSKTPFFELPLAWLGPPGAFKDALFRIAFGMVWAAGGFPRHPFSSNLWHGLGRQGLPKTPLFESPCMPLGVCACLAEPLQSRPMWSLSGGCVGLPGCVVPL